MTLRGRGLIAGLAVVQAGLIALSGGEARASATIVQRATGLDTPVGLANAGDGSNRLFVVEQAGCIRFFHKRVVVGAPCGQTGTRFLDIRNRVLGSCPGGCHQGLIGLAFHPDHETSGFFFVFYTSVADPAPPARNAGDIVIARYALTANRNIADPGSERILLVIPHPSFHVAGQMHFGPDGYLYASIGDPGGHAQDTASMMGKILRIDVDEPMPPYYRIPPTNPFLSGGPGTCGPPFPGSPCDEIWAFGLRNPWRFGFDRLTGDLYIGDVGELSWEEIDFQEAGAAGGRNYGWDVLEGGLHGGQPVPNGNCHQDVPAGSCQAFLNGGSTLPVLEYDTVAGRTVIGGYVYRGAAASHTWTGAYVFADYSQGVIWRGFRDGSGNWQMEEAFSSIPFITTFGEDDLGNLFFVTMDAAAGDLFEIVPWSVGPVPGSTSVEIAATTMAGR